AFVGDAGAGDAAGGVLHQAVVDLLAGDVVDQTFGLAHRAGGVGGQAVGQHGDELVHRALGQDHVDQARVGGVIGVEDVGGQEQLAGAAGADGLDHIGGDGRRDQAQLDLGEGEPGSLDGHGHVAGGDDAGPAAHGRTL